LNHFRGLCRPPQRCMYAILSTAHAQLTYKLIMSPLPGNQGSQGC
jgi:hypothetical protein